ncbi:MAG: universal stress protein [Flavobacterium sp.]|nr:universal stress protein [Pedobacter sp.]
MDKLLVTTDFSANSKTAIRFAMQLASQSGCELVFFNAIEIMKPTSWSQDRYNKYKNEEIQIHQKALQEFINSIFKKSNFHHLKYKCVAEIGIYVHTMINEFAKKIKADFICVSTRGAGKIEKLFGTNASALVSTSPIPVFVVPLSYRAKPITKIWYASDLENLNKELKVLEKFSSRLTAKINVVHYNYLPHLQESKKKFEQVVAKHSLQNNHFQFKEIKADYPLIHYLQIDLTKTKPSLLVVFSQQNRDWYNRIFLSSQSSEITFNTSTPMLVFKKK